MNPTSFVTGLLAAWGIGLLTRAKLFNNPAQYFDGVAALACAVLLATTL